jgi:NADH-quinone oxidoreductase subunit D
MSQIEEVGLDKFKHLVSERALTGETMLLNMGPQHPSTHGVLRLLLELDGEIIVNCIPDIGYLHTGIEKNMEAKTYQKAEVMTDRLDYMNPIGNNLAYVMAVEKLVDLDVPARAQGLRVILTELQRISSHLVWLGTSGLDLAAMSMFLYCFREREQILDIFELVSGQRMMTTYFRPGGVWRDVPVEFEKAVRDFIKIFPKRVDQYETLLTKNPFLLDRTLGIGKLDVATALSFGVTGPPLRASGIDWDLRKARPYCGYEQYDFNVPTRTEGDTYARYLVRVQEMRESLKIVEQALNKLPLGPVRSGNHRHFVLTQELLGFFSKQRPVGSGVNHHGFEFLAQHTAFGVDLIDGHQHGVFQHSFRNGHGARQTVQDAHFDGVRSLSLYRERQTTCN